MATVRGDVKRITYRDDRTHYTVIKIVPDKPEAGALDGEVTVVGNFVVAPSPGEWIEAEGEWVVHHEFGSQFKASSLRSTPPQTARGIERYLGSGAVEGIGPRLAERLVAKFGEKTLEIIEREPHRLLEVEGIGAAKKKAIARATQGDKAVRDALIFLEGYGIAPGTAAKIHRQYGADTIPLVRENPYRLADEVFGIGFRSADAIAKEMGISSDSPTRAKAAIIYLLGQAGNEGHVFLPRSELISRAKSLDIPEEACGIALEQLAEGKEIVLETLGDHEVVYPAFNHHAEMEVAQRLRELAARSFVSTRPAGSAVLAAYTDDGDDALSAEQREAVRLAGEPGGGLLVLTGGPGTGKTTTLRAIVAQLEAEGRSCALAAPTGRAAKRLSEATGREARTIHRLLEYSGGPGERPRFQRNQRFPLDADVVIIDESSMIDLILFYHLLRALPNKAKLILVGDADQLPSVGAGNVLRDLLASKAVPSIRLTQVFRQAEESQIVVNAHRIQQGLLPISKGSDGDFFFMPEEDAEKAKDLICKLVAERLPKYLKANPLQDIQVLSTVRRGPLGVDSLNEALQETLNPHIPGHAQVRVGAHAFRPGDRVMQIRNDYDKMVFNGDIGIVRTVDPKERVVEVIFTEREDPSPVRYQDSDVYQLTLAYCTSVHKSQGSEYPAIVMPITWVMPSLMNRNLLYTAITRARRLVVLVGLEAALRAYVRNVHADERYTWLAQRLKG